MANLRSVQKALEKMGRAAEISGDPQRLAEADKLVLPASAPSAMPSPGCGNPGWTSRSALTFSGGKPFFGICLGLQLLFTKSYEDGVYPVWIVSWRRGAFCRSAGPEGAAHGLESTAHATFAPHLAGLPAEPSVYFVHRCTTWCRRTRASSPRETHYPTPFTSAIWHENVFATQFHPEKSQHVGLTMLRNFVELD